MGSIWRQFLETSGKKSLLTLEVLDAETAERFGGALPAAPRGVNEGWLGDRYVAYEIITYIDL